MAVSKEEVTDADIRKLAKKAGSKWKSIGRELNNSSSDDKDPAFDEEDLREIAESEPTNEERMIKLLQTWKEMSSLHRWAELFAAFDARDVGGDALAVFRQQ